MGENAVNLLIAQHQEIRNLLDQVESGPAESRTLRFEELRQLMNVHETAEEEVLRPITRREAKDGNRLANGLSAQEAAAQQALAALAALDVTSDEFARQFTTFRAGVLDHMSDEESQELDALRERKDVGDLMALGEDVKAAEDPPTSRPDPAATMAAADVDG
jgi:hypothetical protein